MGRDDAKERREGRAIGWLGRFTVFVVALAGLAIGAAVASAEIAQGEVVPESPRRDVPVILDGRVRAHAKVGNRIFVGGDFQQVELNDGTVITQPYLFAYDVDTGELDPNFRPLLNKSVKSLERTAAGDGLFVGGQFSRWETPQGTFFPLRIAKLDAAGNLDTGFTASASAQVLSIEATGSDVYIGGNFTSVNGVSATGVAKLNANSGAIDTGFVFVLGTSIKTGQLVQRIEVTPDGQSLFVLHYASTVNGQVREAVAKMNIGAGAATLSGWTIPWSDQAGRRNCWDGLRDMAMSPDGTFIVIGGQGADNPPNCDSVLKYPTAGNGTVNFLWSARMYSSVFSMAVSDVAVYVGGHFCAAPRNPIPLGGVSSDYPNAINRCNVNDPNDPVNPSVVDPANAVFRKQLAALDPVTGQALPWDPGSDNFVGVFDLTLVDRGLLAGHDRSRFNDVLVGRSGFFDLGRPDDTEAPTIAVTEPAAGAIVVDATQLAGTASDNRDVVSVTVRLKNQTTDLWLQPDGSFASTQADLPVTLNPVGLGEIQWSTPVNDLPSGLYEIRAFSADAAGNTSAPLVSLFTVPEEVVPTCSVGLNAENQPVVSYADFVDAAATTVEIIRNGASVATEPAGTGSFVDSTVTPGDYSYLVRWQPAGVVEDVACTPTTITVPEVGGPTCSVVLDGNDDPLLSWTDVGANRYSIREAGLGFIETVRDGTSYTDTGRAAGDYSYIVRYRQNGVVTDIACTPAPITVPGGPGAACTAVVNGAGDVELTWTAVPGEDSYQVRDNDGWIATVGNDTSYVDTDPTPGLRSYVIRYRQGGVTTDIACSPDPLAV